MEGGRKKSFATELFGEKDKPTASSGVFGSMFAPSSQVLGNQKNGYGNPAWDPKTKGVSGGEGQSKDAGSYYQQEEKAQPFHYSSSIYYGGQDVYNRPPQAAQTPVFSTFNKDGSEDDSGGASRGNWWQGSLYY